ncbi:MAG TPA: tRNA preQ1(34) S-adenosylmethionine ribosyltransferase-isomerase QueA [Thermoflexales bacterium]|nr:tRNA preQ1(34) S-adenosylmethionine ribosyltransferase-isomerase QueA [Thermoflexales bacterium]
MDDKTGSSSIVHCPSSIMHISQLDYHLPPELIAQRPVEPRDSSRLMVIDRAAGSITHKHFYDLREYVRPGDVLVANNSRVIPARLFGRKPSGGKVEVLLLEKQTDTRWKALVGGRNVSRVIFDAGVFADVAPHEGEPSEGSAARMVTFNAPVEPFLESIGHVPLPPYIHETLQDKARYQTVYAQPPGSAAAPTAGLHFTPGLMADLAQRGAAFAYVTLHVGLDTFKPIGEETVEAHKIHGEWCSVSPQTAQAVNNAAGRVFAIGTTSARTLESSARSGQPNLFGRAPGASRISPFEGATSIYITPGYAFKAVDVLVTNFHLPKSTLLAMIGAFMGMDLMREAYRVAVAEKYRFFSFGDAMLIV